MSPAAPTPTGAGPSRTPVQFDERTGGLRIGPYERRVEDPRQPEQVYGAYLSLLYAVRRAQPGERLALRSADLEALLLLVGDDPETIESRLVDLMGCTPAEAGVLGRMLLRQRRATATFGIAAGLSLAGFGLATQVTGNDQAVAPVAVEQPSAAVAEPVEAPAPVAPAAAPVLIAPVSPVQVGPVAPAPRRVVVMGPQVTAPVVVAAPAPVAAPVVQPAPAAPAVVVPAASAAPAAPAAPAAAQPPVEVAPEDRSTLPLVEEPMWDAPPPVDVPESDIGEAVSLVPGPLEPISGVTDSEHDVPVEQISGVTESGPHEPGDVPAAAPDVHVDDAEESEQTAPQA